MRKIKIAQIGVNTNSHSNEIFGSIKSQNDIFDVVGYVLPENERERLPEKLKFYDGCKELTLEEVLNNPEIEAVTLETDEVYLVKYAIMAAKAGKHIHMEKPGGFSLTDFEELLNIMRETKKVFHIGYMYRYNPCVAELLEKIQKGDLGEIISVEAQMNCIHPTAVRKWLKTLPGGMMFFLGCHLVDLILQIKGQPKRIIPYNKCTGYEETDSYDFGMAIFEYENGVSFVKTTACEIGGFARRQLVVSGTKGTVELKPFEMFAEGGNQYTSKTEYFSFDWGDMGNKTDTKSYNRYHPMMRSFAEMVRGEKQNPYTLDYELELYKTVLKACGNNDE